MRAIDCGCGGVRNDGKELHSDMGHADKDGLHRLCVE